MKYLIYSFVLISYLITTSNAYSENATKSYAQKRLDIVEKMPKAKQDQFKNTEAAQKVKATEVSEKLKLLRKEQKSLLLAEKFNKDSYLRKSEEISKLIASKYENRYSAIANLAATYSPEERKALLGAFANTSRKKTKARVKNGNI